MKTLEIAGERTLYDMDQIMITTPRINQSFQGY